VEALISVFIPNFNGAPYMDAQLELVSAQSLITEADIFIYGDYFGFLKAHFFVRHLKLKHRETEQFPEGFTLV
jgi:hypothetical protein